MELILGVAVGIVLLAVIALRVFLGLVIVGERDVGIVIKKFSGKSLAPGNLIALDGEAGIQADTLAPGWHVGYPGWKYRVAKVRVIEVPQGEIALILAEAGAPIPGERILGHVVACGDFQDARSFLKNGGEKGRQLAILTAGTYRINTAIFTVITSENAADHGMDPEMLHVHSVEPDRVGIVTALDGAPIDEGEIAGTLIEGHDNFQLAQTFLDGGGRRGLQEQVLLSGNWNLNPWFVQVEQVPMTEVPIGHVGVVISFVGKPHDDVSGVSFTHGDLVNPGVKGVWVSPLYPGKHPLNTRTMKVELVPTTNIVLNWANRTEAHKYDDKLNSITVRSADGFAFNLDVSQIIHVGALDAPKVISRVGSMQNLVDHVLQPIVGNYFRNSAQACTVLDFLSARSERQQEAAAHIRAAVKAYDVQAIDTLIGDIMPPASLMQTQTDRKIAEEQKKTYEVQREAQVQRQELVRSTSLADIQQELVRSEQGVSIAELQASCRVKEASGEAESTRLRAAADADSLRLHASAEAESIRAKGEAKAAAYRGGVEALGAEAYTAIQVVQVIGDSGVRIVPDVSVSGAGGASGIAEGVTALLLKQMAPPKAAAPNGHA